MIYHKLVRDKIPKIIEEKGGKAEFRTLTQEEYLLHLEKKLDEEVAEYHQDQTLEELADILEVIYALAEADGYSPEELNRYRMEKRAERGGFHDRIFLISKE